MAGKDPKKQQMEYIAIGIFVLVAFFIGITKFKKKDTDDEIFSRKQFNEKWSEVKALEANAPKGESGVEYATRTDRIPLRSPLEKEEEDIEADVDASITLPALVLHGMVWNSMRPQVIIGGKIYDKGEILEVGTGEGASKIEIKDILRDGVYLKYKGKQFIVRPK